MCWYIFFWWAKLPISKISLRKFNYEAITESIVVWLAFKHGLLVSIPLKGHTDNCIEELTGHQTKLFTLVFTPLIKYLLPNPSCHIIYNLRMLPLSHSPNKVLAVFLLYCVQYHVIFERIMYWYWEYIKGILPKRPYLPCVSMAGRALLAG